MLILLQSGVERENKLEKKIKAIIVSIQTEVILWVSEKERKSFSLKNQVLNF